MKTAIISFSRRGYELGTAAALGLEQRGFEVMQYTKSAYTNQFSVYHVEESLFSWTQKNFAQMDALIYIGACGIAVRSIAPFVKDKKHDPAVLVMDEKGTFVISLLSGHLGGANELTALLSEITGGQAVITTATDIHHKLAVDVFAKKNNCWISEMKYAKEVSAALVEGKTVGFYSDFPWIGEIPKGLRLYDEKDQEKPELGIVVSAGFSERPYLHCLYLIPRVITLGIGCRKHTPEEDIEAVVRKVCNELLIPSVAIEQAATIDVKKEEPGLLAYCAKRSIPLYTYTAEELLEVEGQFSASEFVRKTVGVDNVCERSAVKACGDGRIIHRKYADRGVTVALTMKKWSVNFE